jgi:CheY-like chemotaxis protein
MVLLGNIDLLQLSAALPQTATDRLVRMHAAADRGARITDQLLTFSRRQPLGRRMMELNTVVRGMIELLESAIGSNIRVAARLTEEPWSTPADPTEIELLLVNLVLNAREAMPGGGALTIETDNVSLGVAERPEDPPAGDYAMLSVRDTGTGMAPEIQARAFVPLFTTKGPGQGSGLGLSQVHALARRSGGGMRIDSVVGQGTVVRVYLPSTLTKAEPARGSAAAGRIGNGRDPTVLLVDDDEAVRSTTAMVLATMGYSVLESSTGRRALDLLASDPGIAVLLTDVAMPGMNGAELARHARTVRPGLPIVFFSGYADPDAVAEDAILHRLVRKPFRATELVAQIKAAMLEADTATTVPSRPRGT